MGKGSSGSSGTTTTVQNNTPWAGQQPYLKDVYEQAQTAYGATPKDPYAGELTAAPSQTQQSTNNLAFGTGQDLFSAGSGLGAFGLGQTINQFNRPQTQQVGQPGTPMTGMNTAFLRPDANPFLMPSLAMNIRDAAGYARDVALPQLNSQAWQQGAYGGTAHGTAMARTAKDVEDAAARETGNSLTNIWNQAYGTERGIEAGQQSQLAQQNAQWQQALLALAPQLFQQGLSTQGAGLQTMQAAGGQEQAWRQDLLNQALQRYQMQQAAPWTGLSEYSATVGGGIPGGGTTTAQAPSTSTFGNFLGGALGGGTLGYGAGSFFGQPLIGAGIGALAGGLGGIYG